MYIEHEQQKQKTSQDKRTLDLVDAKEKPQDGENPLINSSYYYSIVQQRERVQISNSLAQNNPIKISSQQQSTTALTRRSTLVKAAPKRPPSSSVNNRSIRPSKPAKVNPK